MGRTWEIEKTWGRQSSDGDWYECFTTDGHLAATLCVVREGVVVVLSAHLDRECDLGRTMRMPYDEAQVLLACFDLTLPPLPEANSEQAP